MEPSKRGGARHFAKPYVDSDILFKLLGKHVDLLRDLGPYELISSGNAPDPAGLVHALPLWETLVRIEPSGEIHSQPLRLALLNILAENPEVNSGKHNGQIWVNLKLQRLTCLLTHCRKMKREGMAVAAAKLRKDDFLNLQEALGLLKLEDVLEKTPAPRKPLKEEAPAALEKAASSSRKMPLEKELSEALVPYDPDKARRKLKQEDSEVSLDSKGYPKMFGSSPEVSPMKGGEASSSAAPPLAFSRRRGGGMVSLEKEELQDALGLASKKKPALGKAAALGKAKASKPNKKKRKSKRQSLTLTL